MTADEREKMGTWVQIWARAGKALEEIKRRELRAYNYNQNREVVDGMLQWACDHATARLGSGLVEQQRFFQKMKEK
jgi:hypothetical protein